LTIRVLFAGQNFNFMEDIIERFRRHPQFSVQTDHWKGHHNHDESRSLELLKSSDVIIANWLLGNAVWYSQNKLPGQQLLIRYHRFEITTEFPKQLNLQNVDAIVSASSVFQPQLESLLQLPKQKSTFIYNPIPCERLERPKMSGSDYHLGLLGYNRKLKGLHRALDVWEELAATDERYKLFIKGSSPKETGWVWRDPEENSYFTEQFERISNSPYKDRVQFQPFNKDVAEWLSNIGYILSTSDFESFHCAAAEGMASGSIPLIANWTGADTIYPSQYIFSTAQEMAEAVRKYNANPTVLAAKRHEARSYVKEHFDTGKIFEQYMRLIKTYRGG